MDKLTYKKLQALAKKQGIPANLGKATLIAKLSTFGSSSEEKKKATKSSDQMEVEEMNEVRWADIL